MNDGRESYRPHATTTPRDVESIRLCLYMHGPIEDQTQRYGSSELVAQLAGLALQILSVWLKRYGIRKKFEELPFVFERMFACCALWFQLCH